MINKIQSSIKSNGYVGDTKPVILAYLSMVSALLDKPVSLLLKGASGAGKSFALKSAKQYVPDEAYEEFSGMSEKTLAYLGDSTDLKHQDAHYSRSRRHDWGHWQSVYEATPY